MTVAAASPNATSRAKAAAGIDRRMTGRVVDAIIPTALIVLTVVAWEALVHLFAVPKFLLPAPSAIARELVTKRGVLLDNLSVTMLEIALGFLLAFVAGVTHGIALGYSRIIRRATFPIIIASQTIPIITIAPIFTIWFGYDLLPRILIAALACFFPLTINTAAGFSTRDRETEQMFRALGASRTQCFFKLAVPTALPHIFTGMRISATLSVIGATISEWTSSSRGLGHLILLDTNQLNTVRVFAAIIVLSVTGTGLFAAVALLEYLSMPWRRRSSKRTRKFGRST